MSEANASPTVTGPLRIIDPHIHMVARTTDDYAAMRAAGVVAVIEPAFWVGQPRTTVGTFIDYFASLIGWERFRASQFGISHYCTMGLNSKEANNEALAEQVMEVLPRFAGKEGVVAIGEIGYDEITAAEDKYFRLQIELAKKLAMPIMVHTPHRNKKVGTTRSMDVILEHGVDPTKVVIDHNTEETCKETLDRGFWCAFTIYPKTKMGNMRMVNLIKQYGSDRIIIDSSADWGMSDPLAVPKTARLMLDNGISYGDVHKACYANALMAYGQSGQMAESDWLSGEGKAAGETAAKPQSFEGNSILRGGGYDAEDDRVIQ